MPNIAVGATQYGIRRNAQPALSSVACNAPGHQRSGRLARMDTSLKPSTAGKVDMACTVVPWLFTVGYGFALVVFLVGTFGWFGVSQDPLSGLFLTPLGIPWAWAASILPESTWPFLVALAPAINVVLLFWLCQSIRNL